MTGRCWRFPEAELGWGRVYGTSAPLILLSLIASATHSLSRHLLSGGQCLLYPVHSSSSRGISGTQSYRALALRAIEPPAPISYLSSHTGRHHDSVLRPDNDHHSALILVVSFFCSRTLAASESVRCANCFAGAVSPQVALASKHQHGFDLLSCRKAVQAKKPG
jgi:hypothetical protein